MTVQCTILPERTCQFCRNYLKFMWKHKYFFLLVFVFLYVTIYIGIYTIVTARKLPKARHNSLDLMHGVKTRILHGQAGLKKEIEKQVFNATRPHTTEPVIHFEFNRNDLRLNFKLLPYIDPNAPTYDNIKEFPCVQSNVMRRNLGPNDTQDLMCIPRPAYLPQFKNPCYKLGPHVQPQRMGGVHCLPYFHILGNDKCGTTDFHSRLTSHPLVLLNNGGIGKEIYYWCWLRYGLWMKGTAPKRKFDSYTFFFHVPSLRIINEYSRTKQQMITGDGTPMDFWDFRGWQEDPQNWGLSEPKFLTPHAMRHLYRNPKFIVLMRNPVDRIYSDYVFLGYGFSAAKFAQDVPKAIAMVRDCLKVNTTRQCFFSDDMYHNLPMRIHISCYSVFFREWLSVFHRDHFLVIRTEDYHSEMQETLRKAYEFLDVESLSQVELDRIASQHIKHETSMKKKAGPMFAQTRALLEEFFAPFNEDLAMLMRDERFLWKDTVIPDS